MKIKITKITALNSYLRLMTIEIDGYKYTIRITDELYQRLKIKGIPTGQKLRYESKQNK